MNNFAIILKLVFVAAAVLLLAAAVVLFSSAAQAAPARAAALHLAAPEPSFSILEHSASVPGGVDQERRLSPGPIIGLICAIVASSMALGVAFGLRRRIERIAGPDRDTADDD